MTRPDTRSNQYLPLLAALDFVVLSCVAASILLIRNEFSIYPIVVSEVVLFVLSSVSAVIFFHELDLYDTRVLNGGINQTVALAKGMLWVGILQSIAFFLIKDKQVIDYSRGNIAFYVFAGLASLVGMRVGLLRPLLRHYRIIEPNRRRTIVVGAGAVGQRLAVTFGQSTELGLSVECFIDDDPAKLGGKVLGRPVVGGVEDIDWIVRDQRIEEIFIAINTIEYPRLLEIIERCRRTGLPVTVTANHFRIVHENVSASPFELKNSVTLRPLGVASPGRTLKRTFDILGAGLLLFLLTPLFAVIAAWIKLNSPGPIFYKADVVGREGKGFTWYKFRTMVPDRREDVHRDHVARIIKENRGTRKLRHDPRITRPGYFLRKYSLDELPQLINVLRGEMSLIGPRPCLPYEYEAFSEWHRRRFAVTPGITGLWQVVGRDRADVTFNDAVILDLYYIENQSFWFDIKIILKTIPIVLFGRGGV